MLSPPSSVLTTFFLRRTTIIFFFLTVLVLGDEAAAAAAAVAAGTDEESVAAWVCSLVVLVVVVVVDLLVLCSSKLIVGNDLVVKAGGSAFRREDGVFLVVLLLGESVDEEAAEDFFFLLLTLGVASVTAGAEDGDFKCFDSDLTLVLGVFSTAAWDENASFLFGSVSAVVSDGSADLALTFFFLTLGDSLVVVVVMLVDCEWIVPSGSGEVVAVVVNFSFFLRLGESESAAVCSFLGVRLGLL